MGDDNNTLGWAVAGGLVFVVGVLTKLILSQGIFCFTPCGPHACIISTNQDNNATNTQSALSIIQDSNRRSSPRVVRQATVTEIHGAMYQMTQFLNRYRPSRSSNGASDVPNPNTDSNPDSNPDPNLEVDLEASTHTDE
tara:strand:+ start:360 stop:776 length:417 start_codon:yes stop_codon:yes gene_type:complete